MTEMAYFSTRMLRRQQCDCWNTTKGLHQRSRTQMTAVKQKLLTVTYFSPENVPFAQKTGRKKCSGKSSNQKVILLYQPSTRMPVPIRARPPCQFGLFQIQRNKPSAHARGRSSFSVRVMTTAGSTRARIIANTIRAAFTCIDLPRDQ